MPTGYTAAVGDGKITTLREFALQCARGMGACIMMRDDPWDAPIPERFEPSTDYHEKRLAAARATLAELADISAGECEARAKAAFESETASQQEYLAKKATENQRYRDMHAAVTAWSTEAEGIREFMLEQLFMSIDDWERDPPIQLTGEEWLERELETAARDIAYHKKAVAEEIERTEARNRWLAALRASLPAS